MLEDPFWQRALLQAVSPIVAAVVGTLGIGWIARWISERNEQHRDEHALREQLIIQMTEAASALYLATQRYWRAKTREKAGPERLAALRTTLDEQYHNSRVAGEAIETRLRVYFRSDRPRQSWHATMDLLTVRYFQLIDLATEKLLKNNAGGKHSGLDIDTLRNSERVLEAYHGRLLESTEMVLREDIHRYVGAHARTTDVAHDPYTESATEHDDAGEPDLA